MAGLSRTTDAATEPITTAEAKTHLRITGSDDDTYIESLIKAARMWIEDHRRVALISQTWAYKFDNWPAREIVLPRPPLISITSIAYLDESGVSQTWSSANYTAQTTEQPGRVTLAYSASWPSHRDIENAITVTYLAGYANASTVPENFKHALKLLITHWYEMRAPVNIGNIVTPIPMTVMSLLPQEAYCTI